MNRACVDLGMSWVPDLGEMYTESWDPVLPEGWGEDSSQVESELFSWGLCWEGPQDSSPVSVLQVCGHHPLHHTVSPRAGESPLNRI